MKLLEYSPSTPEENLALDEAILEQAECGAGPSEVLRLWEPSSPLVVVGRSSRVTVEVNQVACEQAGIPILRRCSGGAAVVTGPGCLMYSVVLAYRQRPELRMLDQAHGFVLGVMSRALSGLASDVVLRGTSDLARGDRKFSGNSLRCKREHLLYHGTILYNFPLDLIGRYLGIPPRQPAYRQQRTYGLRGQLSCHTGSLDRVHSRCLGCRRAAVHVAPARSRGAGGQPLLAGQLESPPING